MAVDNQGNPIPDVNAPAVTGGSGLGDVLAGIGGANISRPAIGAGIANGQALAGLRTAQTEDALQKAMNARDEAQARQGLQQAIRALPGETDSSANFKTAVMLSGFANAQQAFDAFKVGQETGNRAILGDPNQLGSPAQTAAQQGVQGKIAEPVNVPNAYVVPAGQPQPNVQVSPIGAADIAEKHAQAAAANTRAANGSNQMDPELAPILGHFITNNPAAASNLRSMTNGGGPLTIAAYMAENGDPAAAAYMARKLAGSQTAIPPNQVHPGANTPGVAPPVPGQPTVQPLQPGQEEHNGPQNTMSTGIQPAPGVSLSEQAKIRNDVASSKGLGGQVSNANTMFLHSKLFDEVADQLGNGNFTPTNEINVLWQRVFGGPAPGNLQLVGSFLGREAVRATVNAGAGTGEERELHTPDNSSPTQLHEAASKLRSLVGSALSSRDLAALRGGADITHFLDPETQQAFAPMLAAHRALAANGWKAPAAAPVGIPSSDAIDAELARRAQAGQ
jgi:hypothetical protein